MSSTINSAAQQLQATSSDTMDSIITINPQASLFNYNFDRVDIFSKNTARLNFVETIDFGKTINCEIKNYGHLLNSLYLVVTLPTLQIPSGSSFIGYTNAVGYAMIDSIELLMGEIVIVRQSGEMLEMLDYLTVDASKKKANDSMVGRYDNVDVLNLSAKKEQTLTIPLKYWFTKSLDASLPIVSLRNHKIKIRIKLKKFQDLVTYDGNILPTNTSIIDCYLMGDYYLLPQESVPLDSEKQVFVIEQYQQINFNINSGVLSSIYNLLFTKNIKEILFVIQDNKSAINNDYFNYGSRDPSNQGSEFIKNVTLLLNGNTRFDTTPEVFYRNTVVTKYHTCAGNRNIYCIPFSETPEINQPTGGLNLSLYSNIELMLEYLQGNPNCTLMVFGINYQVLTIQNGISSVEYLL